MNNIKFKAKRIDCDEYVEGYYFVRSGRFHPRPKIFVQSHDLEEPDQEYEIDHTTLEVIYSKDSVINSVVDKILSRSDVGIKKYNTTLDRTDLTLKDWLTHLQEELMDAVNYITRIKNDL